MQTSEPDLLSHEGITLVFGLEWFPLLGDHFQAQARSLAARRRARRSVITASGAASVGLLGARLPRAAKQRYCSAAAAFAALHPVGTVAAVVPFPGERHWLVAVHEGAVMTRTDQVFTSISQAQETLRVLREAHPGLHVHDENQASTSLLEALFDVARERAALARVRQITGATRIMLVSTAMIGVVLFWLLVTRFWPAPEGISDAGIVDATAAWTQVISASARSHNVHGVAGLHALLEALYEVPAVVAGWRLTQIECRPGSGQWACRSRYRRDAGSDNLDFLSAALPAWRVTFDPLEGAEAAWSAPMPVVPLATAALRRPHQNEAWFVSALQTMLPAFTELRLEAPQVLPFRPPPDAQLRPIARPQGTAGYRRRALRVQAPLRSLGLLLPETAHVSWERLLLQVAPVDQPTVRHSGLRVSLSGVLYEIDDPYPLAHVSVDDSVAVR